MRASAEEVCLSMTTSLCTSNHNPRNARAGALVIHHPAWVGSSHRWVRVNTHTTPVPLFREAVGGSTPKPLHSMSHAKNSGKHFLLFSLFFQEITLCRLFLCWCAVDCSTVRFFVPVDQLHSAFSLFHPYSFSVDSLSHETVHFVAWL